MRNCRRIALLLSAMTFCLSGLTASGTPPVANDITVTTYTGRVTRIPIGDAYSDTDSLVGDLYTAIVAPASYGTATASGGFLYYEANPGYTGSDSFTWEVADESSTSSVAQCDITVTDQPMPQTKRIMLIVEERIRPEIETRLQRLKDDLELDGYEASIIDWNDTAGNFTASSNLWDTLRGDYYSSNPLPLAGAVLIGELPLPNLLDECGTETDKTYWHLGNGDFGKYNYDIPEIWVSRMNGRVGDYEMVELHNLLDANHLCRSGQTRSSHDGWWFNSAYPEYNSYYYPDGGYNLRYLCLSDVSAGTLPTDPYTDCATAGMLGGEMLDTSSHAGNGYNLPVYSPYRMPFQVRTILMTSCFQWRKAQSFLLGRHGLSTLSPGASHSTYMGSLNSVQTADITPLTELRTTNVSWGDCVVDNYYSPRMWGEMKYGVYWGDLSLGATLAPHNEPPVINTFNISSQTGAAPHTAVFTANATDTDGSISLYEWFCRGYRCPIEEPVFAGASLACVTNIYTKPYRYVAEAHVLDNYLHLGMSERKDVLVAPDPSQTMRVNIGHNVDSYLPHLEYTDSQTNLWLHEQDYTAGTWGRTSGGTDTRIVQPVDGTQDDEIYQQFREGNSFFYSVPLTNGTYALLLHFADMRSSGAGERVMDITLQDETAVTGLDIVSHVGPDHAHTLTFLADVTNGVLTFGMETNSGYATDIFLNAFTIEPDTGSVEPGPTITSPLDVSAPDWTPFSYTIAATGRDGTTYTAENLPEGLELAGDTISGTPNVPVGMYEITLHATNADGTRTFTMWLDLTKPVTARIGVDPLSANVAPGASATFTATAYSEYDTALPQQPEMTWSVSGGGSISTAGVFTAGMTTGGPYRVLAEAEGITGFGMVSVSELTSTNTYFVWKANVTGAWDNADNWTPEGFTNGAGVTCIADSGQIENAATFKPGLYLLDGATLSVSGDATINGSLHLGGGLLRNGYTGPYNRTLTVNGGVEMLSNTVSEIDAGSTGFKISTYFRGHGDMDLSGTDSFYVPSSPSFSGHIEASGTLSIYLRSNGTYSFGPGGSIRVNAGCEIYQSSYSSTWTVPGGVILNGGMYRQPGKGTRWTAGSPWIIESASVMQMDVSSEGYSDILGPLHGGGALRLERIGSLDRAFNFRGAGSSYSNTITIAAEPLDASLYIGTSGALPTNGPLASLRIEASGVTNAHVVIGARKLETSVSDMPDADVKVETLTCGGRAVPPGIYSQANPVPEEGYVFFNNASSSLEVMSELPTPQITSYPEADIFLNQPFEYEVTAEGADPLDITITNAPAWMTLNGSYLGGVPTQLGNYKVTIRVANEYGYDTVVLDVDVYAAPGDAFTISAAAGTGGSIDPSGEIVVLTSNDQAFVISPDTGYEIADVLVDSVSVGAVSGYTFSNVTDHHTIDASFALVPDLEAPSVPQDLSATVASISQIDLSWTASTDNVAVAGYEISRNGSYLTSVAGTSYSDTGLDTGTEYTYTILAYDAAANKSAQSAPVSATTLSTLVAHWKLDDGSGTNLLDSSGNGHTGTLYGDPEWVSGTNLGAVYCDGAGDWLSFPEVLNMEAETNWTVMMWFRLDTLPSDSNDIWLWKYEDVTEQGDSFLYVDDDDGIKAFNGQKIDSGIKVQTNVWYHVAGVKSGSSYSIYVNGQQEVSSASYNFSTTGSGYEIFKDDGRVWGHGALDDVRVYEAALGHTEITNIMYSVEGEEPFVVRIGPPAASDGSFSLSFDSDPGQMYEVLYKDDLMSTNDWQVLTNGIEGTGSAIEWEDPNSGIRGFYRIREEM